MVASKIPDILDLSERGEALKDTPSMSPCDSTATVSPSPTMRNTEDKLQEAVSNKVDVSGRVGCALFKRKCREWDFLPALEAEFSLALEYLATEAQSTFHELQTLEQQNRMDGRDDYKHYRPDNEFGDKKDELMTNLILSLEKFGGLFTLANTIMNQHAPNAGLVREYMQWSNERVAPNPLNEELAAINYRALGPRPSMIDEFLHSIVKTVAILWTIVTSTLARFKLTSPIASNMEPIILSYPTLHVLSHVLVVVMAAIFFVMPLSIMYLKPMSKVGIVLVTISFSLLFCVGTFYFGGGSGGLKTDYKFLLLFAYTSVMATLLSNLAQHQE